MPLVKIQSCESQVYPFGALRPELTASRFGMPQLVDPDTPDSAKTRTGFDGEEYELVFSDEFNVDGRTFYPGDDPYWEAVDLHYWPTGDLGMSFFRSWEMLSSGCESLTALSSMFRMVRPVCHYHCRWETCHYHDGSRKP